MKTNSKFTLSLPLMLSVALLLSATSSLPVATAGSVSSYYADTDVARWVTESSIFECTMRQHIPGFGDAVFYQQAGELLSFYLQAPANPMQEGRALLTSQPPVWRQDLDGRDLGYVTVSEGRRPVTLDTARSRMVLSELDRGMVPTLMRRAWFSEEESVHIGLSPVQFATAYADYHRCMDDLLPVNFGQIERSTVFWLPNQRELGDDARQLLDNIMAYTHADPAIYAFEINGFTDGAGNPRDNLELSRVRAFAVQDYLISQGLDENMLTTRFFGSTPEFHIVRDERSAADRDRNRRVTIRILRR